MPFAHYFLLGILGAASWTDWRYRTIPNNLLFFSFAFALCSSLLNQGLPGLLFSLLGTLAGFCLLIIPYRLGGMGAGDVKLLMVIGSFTGPKAVISCFILGALAGGIIALGIYLYNYLLGKNITSLPYGIPLSLGTIVYLLLSGRL